MTRQLIHGPGERPDRVAADRLLLRHWIRVSDLAGDITIVKTEWDRCWLLEFAIHGSDALIEKGVLYNSKQPGGQ